MKIRTLVVAGIMVIGMIFIFSGCDDIFTATGTEVDRASQQEVQNILASNQSIPTDINYSLERYNLIRRAYWVNGQKEKANTLICSVEKPLGYIVLFTDNGGIIGKFVVDGKVTSLNSYLTPDSECYEIANGNSSCEYNEWLADIDGSYGENDNGIFFFTTDGKYVEWTGTYLYTDIPMVVDNPVITFTEVGNE